MDKLIQQILENRITESINTVELKQYNMLTALQKFAILLWGNLLYLDYDNLVSGSNNASKFNNIAQEYIDAFNNDKEKFDEMSDWINDGASINGVKLLTKETYDYIMHSIEMPIDEPLTVYRYSDNPIENSNRWLSFTTGNLSYDGKKNIIKLPQGTPVIFTHGLADSNEIIIHSKYINKSNITNEKIIESLSSARKKYLDTGKVDKATFNAFIQKDPSNNKKYLEWMLKQRLSGYSRSGHLGDVIRRFDTLVNRNRIKKSDIGTYKSVEDVESAMNELSTEKSKTQIKKDVKLKDATKVYEDENVVVINPHTHSACMLYGKNTKWCITEEDGHYWNDYRYNSNVEFYFIILKDDILILPNTISSAQSKTAVFNKGEKYAVAVYSDADGRVEVYDEQDNLVSGIDTIGEVESAFGVPEDVLEEAELGDRWAEKYEIAKPATIDNIKTTIEELDSGYSTVMNIYFIGDTFDPKEYAEDVFNWFSEQGDSKYTDEIDEIDDINDGANPSYSGVADALRALGYATKNKDKKGEEESNRRDIPGQQKMEFSNESIDVLKECLKRF